MKSMKSMKSKKITAIVMLSLSLSASASAWAAMPKITGTPVVDTAKILEWPTDQGSKKPKLDDATANLLWDFHGTLDTCDLVLSTEGNYHMALHDIWPKFLAKFQGDSLHNAFYTTSPPIMIPQLENGVVQFGNLYATCKPSVAVASKRVIDKLVASGVTDGPAYPFYQDRGEVILVKHGNPKNIHSVWDLGRKGVRLVTPNVKLESGAFNSYAEAIYNIAAHDPHPPKGWTAEKLINVLFNGKSNDKEKWLEGARIHHRDEPWSVAYGKADAAMILYHIGLYTKQVFPETFDVISLGGTLENPQPLAGTKVGVREVVALKGNWNAKQLNARNELVKTFRGPEFTETLEKHGLSRPDGFVAESGN